MPTLTQMEYFIAVAELGHFGQAAKRCHISQPTLSMQLAKMEDTLGVSLLDRSKKPILLTKEGEEIFSLAKSIVRQAKALHEVAKNSQTEPAGELSLGVIPTVSPFLVPQFLTGFIKKNWKIELHIEELPTRNLMERLQNDTLDCAICATPLPEGDLSWEVLYYEKLMWLEKRIEGTPKKLKLNDLDQKQVWLLSKDHCLSYQMESLCRIGKQNEVSSHVEFRSGNLFTLFNLISKRGGGTLVPETAAASALKLYPNLRVREFTDSDVPYREISLVRQRTVYKGAMIGRLKSLIQDSLSEAMRADLKKKVPRTVLDPLASGDAR